jgi:hypothetical protein
MPRKPKFFKTEKPNRSFKKKPNVQPYVGRRVAGRRLVAVDGAGQSMIGFAFLYTSMFVWL